MVFANPSHGIRIQVLLLARFYSYMASSAAMRTPSNEGDLAELTSMTPKLNAGAPLYQSCLSMMSTIPVTAKQIKIGQSSEGGFLLPPIFF
jgi:hypothetical protein